MPRPYYEDDGDVFMTSPGKSTVTGDSDVTMRTPGNTEPDPSPLPRISTRKKDYGVPTPLPHKRSQTKPLPIPYPISPAKAPVELGSNRDDVSGIRWERYQRVLEAACDTCLTPIHKEVLQVKLDKSFEPISLSKNSSREFLSSNRQPRPELRFQKLEAEIKKFLSLVLPDPDTQREKEKKIRAKFDPKTPKVHRKRKPIVEKTLVPWETLSEQVQARLSKWAPDDFIKTLYESELLEHRWAILSAWIWRYLQDCHFLSSRVKDYEEDEDDDVNVPIDLNELRYALPLSMRPSDLDGVDPPLPVRSKVHQAWHTLLEEFAPHRNFPGVAPGATITTPQQKAAEYYAIAYDVWRKTTQALLPRTSLTSEFPYSSRDVVPHLAEHIAHLLKPEDFPKTEILKFAGHQLRHQYTGDPTYVPNPYDEPSEEELEKLRIRDIAAALVDVVETAIDFRNEKDRDARAWEILFRPPSTAETWEADKTAPSHSFPLDESIMVVITDSREPVHTNMGPPPPPSGSGSSGKRSRANSQLSTPSRGKGKGKQSSTPSPIKLNPLTNSGRQWQVVFVATPLLYENRFIRSGYTAFDQYHFNNLRVVLKGTPTSKEKWQAVVDERSKWMQFRDKTESDDDHSDYEDPGYNSSDTDGKSSSPLKRKNKKQQKPTTPPSSRSAGRKRQSEEMIGTSPTDDHETGRDPGSRGSAGAGTGSTGSTTAKRQKRAKDQDVLSEVGSQVANSPSVGAKNRRETRRASAEKEKREREQREKQEALERRRRERERINAQRVALGLEPLGDEDDETAEQEIKRPRFFGWG